MSWIFGIYHKVKTDITPPLELTRNALHRIENNRIQMVAGGNPHTLFSTTDADPHSGLLVSGIGLNTGRDRTTLFSDADWANALKQPDRLNGHFAAVHWNGDHLSITTDSMGLRDIYLAETENTVFFTTRLDLLASWFKLELDFPVFGSRWLLFNQLSADSIVRPVTRLTCGAGWDSGGRMTRHVPAAEADEEPDDYLRLLTRLLTVPDRTLSLSLSGGLDSRVLLAVLLSLRNRNWNTHTFGPASSADVQMAKRMAASLGFVHHHIERPLPPADDLLQEISDYSAQTLLNNPASSVLQLRNYKEVDPESLVIDGGFGEIWRKEFLYKLQLRGRPALYGHNLPALLPLLRYSRADLFRKEHNPVMQAGCLTQLEDLLNTLPPVLETGLDHWLDLFTLRTRLINAYSPEQSWLDQWVTGIMPFVQPILLTHMDRLTAGAKRDGRFFKRIIRQTAPRLARLPLVKGRSLLPFGLNTLQARIWTKLFRKFSGPDAIETHRRQMLQALDEWISDTVHSTRTRECSWLDYQKVQAAYTQYKQTGDSPALDWWVALHCFKQRLQPDR